VCEQFIYVTVGGVTLLSALAVLYSVLADDVAASLLLSLLVLAATALISILVAPN